MTTHFKNGEATDWIDRTVPVPTPKQPDAGAVDAGVRAAEEAERGDHADERPRPGDGTKRVTSI